MGVQEYGAKCGDDFPRFSKQDVFFEIDPGESVVIEDLGSRVSSDRAVESADIFGSIFCDNGEYFGYNGEGWSLVVNGGGNFGDCAAAGIIEFF